MNDARRRTIQTATAALICGLLLASCIPRSDSAPTTAPPATDTAAAATLLATLTRAATVVPSPTPTGTHTPSPTPTPTPTTPLNAQGPYLLHAPREDLRHITVFNPNGTGASVIQLPGDTQYFFWDRALSPTGQWLAFHTQSAGDETSLALWVAQIPGGDLRHVADLVFDAYPDNLIALADRWVAEYPDQFNRSCMAFGDSSDPTPCNWAAFAQMDFATSLHATAWSPDGNYLAFTGLIDGPSSDVYMLDMRSGEVRRLTDDIMNAGHSTWSPDGRWLITIGIIPHFDYPARTMHLADPFGPVQSPAILWDGVFWGGMGWLSDGSYLLTHRLDGAIADIILFDLASQQFTNLWPASYEYAEIDPERAVVYVSPSLDRDLAVASQGWGLYSVDMQGRIQYVNEMGLYALRFRGSETSRMYGSDGERLYRVDEQGSITPLSQLRNATVAIAPDRRWAAVYNSDAIELYDARDELAMTFAFRDVSVVAWRPDSAGFLVVACNDAWTYLLEDQQWALVLSIDEERCALGPSGFAWAAGPQP